MENINDFDANKARLLSDKNGLKLEQALDVIQNTASNGGRSQAQFCNMNNEVMIELIRKGFAVSKIKDPMGLELSIVSW